MTDIPEDESFGSADPMDTAQRVERMQREQQIKQQLAKYKPEQEKNPDGSWPVTECVDCEDDLPQERMEMGRIRCVVCQSKLERRR
jgi:RNA polymerase-binding transcription factor DksA